MKSPATAAQTAALEPRRHGNLSIVRRIWNGSVEPFPSSKGLCWREPRAVDVERLAAEHRYELHLSPVVPWPVERLSFVEGMR